MGDNKPKKSPKEFAETVRAKYPEYQNVTDDVLIESMLKKYPQYKESINFDNKEVKTTTQPKPTQTPTQSTKNPNWVGDMRLNKEQEMYMEENKSKPVTPAKPLQTPKSALPTNNFVKTLNPNSIQTSSNLEQFNNARNLSTDEASKIKQDLDAEINEEGVWNTISASAKKWWNNAIPEQQLQVDVNPLSESLREVKKIYGNKITPEEATKKAYDLELDKRQGSLRESKEREFLKTVQVRGDKDKLLKEQNKQYDKASSERNDLAKKKYIFENEYDTFLDSFENQVREFASIDTKSFTTQEQIDQYNNRYKELEAMRGEGNRLFQQYKETSDQLAETDGKISSFEHNLDMFKRDYGTFSNLTHRIGNALGDTGKGIVTVGIEAPLDYMVSMYNKAGNEVPSLLSNAKDVLRTGRETYETDKEQRKSLHEKDLSIDDIHSASDFGNYMGQLLSGQSYNLVAASTGMGGLAIMGGSSAGNKRSDILQDMEQNGKEYNAFQQIATPLLSGAVEMAGGYVTYLNFNRAKSVIQAANNSQRELIGKNLFTQLSKNYIAGSSSEAIEESGVQLANNLLDIYVLGKEEVRLFDGVKDAAAAGFFIGAAMQSGGAVASVAAKGLSSFSYDSNITKLSDRIVKLEAELQNPNLTDAERTIVENNITETKKKSEELLKKKISTVENMSNEDFQRVLTLEQEQADIRNKAKEIQNGNLSKDLKKSELQKLQEELNKNDEERVNIIKASETNPVITESNEKSTQPTTEETTTEQKEEIAVTDNTNDNESVSNEEYDAQSDLDFLKSLDQNVNEEIVTTEQEIPVSEEVSNYQAPDLKEIKLSDKGESYSVSVDNGAVSFKNKNGVEPSAPIKRKLLKEYAKNTDFDKGSRASEVQSVKDIAEQSNNPLEVAENIVNLDVNQYEELIDYKTRAISDLIGKVNKESFLRFGDKNNIVNSLARSYFAPKGTGQNLDTLAQEISEVYSIEVTPEDIYEFMLDNPNGTSGILKKEFNKDKRLLSDRFTQLTGLPATEGVLQQVIENELNKKQYQEQLSQLDFLTDEQLQQLYNEQQEAITQSDQKLHETEVSTTDAKRSETTTESTRVDQSEQTSIDLASDIELQALVDERTIYDKLYDTLEKWENELDQFGRGNLSMGLPLVVAKGAIKVMKAAALTTKKADEIVRAGFEFIKESDYYKNLSKNQQKKITLANFRNLIAESIRDINKTEKELIDLKDLISDLKQNIKDGKSDAKSITKDLVDFLKNNKVKGKITPTEINRLVRKANEIHIRKDKQKALTEFENLFTKIQAKADARSADVSQRSKVEKRIAKELAKGKTDQEIINLFPEGSTNRMIAKDYFERTKNLTDEQVREKTKQMVDDAHNERYRSEKLKARLKKATEKFYELFFDRAMSLKKTFNEAGMQFATSLFIASKGAPGYANRLYQKAHEKIFAGLTVDQTDNLNTIIRLRRIIAIETNRDSKAKDPMVFNHNFNKETAERALQLLEQDLGATEYANLKDRADKFFTEQRNVLELLHKEGIISDEMFDDLKDVEYIKTRYLDFLSQEEQNSTQVTKGASTDNMMESMKNGWDGAVEMNANELLAQAINTAAKSIAMNRLNNGVISEFNKTKAKVEGLLQQGNLSKAEQKIVDGFKLVRSKIIPTDSIHDTAPKGFTKIKFFENGVEKMFFMDDALYNQYSDNVVSMFSSSKFKNLTQIVSGVKIVKTIATGQNPTFFITNAPRDYFWILNTSKHYSNFVPVGMMQLAYDFFKASVKDIKNESTTYERAVEYGIMMDFLHLQGKMTFDINPKSILGKSVSFIGDNKASQGVKYLWNLGLELGAYSEIGFRMAVFNRATDQLLKQFNKENNTNYKSVEDIDQALYPKSIEQIYTEAVVEARESTVDFNQGGRASKDIESVIPYFNAATQGTRMLMEKLNENPIGYSSRIMQTVSIVVGAGISVSLLALQSMMGDDDGDVFDMYNEFYSGVSKFDRANYFVIPIGKNEKGEFDYIRMALPQSLTPFFAIGRGVTHDLMNTLNNKDAQSFLADDLVFTFQNNVSFVDREILAKIPIFKSFVGYYTGYDFFRKQQVSTKSGDVPVIAEGFESDLIEGFYKRIGTEFDMSPARTKLATESFITTPSTNVAIGLLYGGLNTILSKENNDKSTLEVLSKSVSGRVRKSTSDFNRKVINNEDFKNETDVRKRDLLIKEQEAKRIVKKVHENEITREAAINTFKEIFPDDKQRVKNLIERMKFNPSKFSSNSLDLKYADKDLKGELLYEHFKSDLKDNSKLSPKQLKLKQELIKLKVLTPNAIQTYDRVVKREKQ